MYIMVPDLLQLKGNLSPLPLASLKGEEPQPLKGEKECFPYFLCLDANAQHSLRQIKIYYARNKESSKENQERKDIQHFSFFRLD